MKKSIAIISLLLLQAPMLNAADDISTYFLFPTSFIATDDTTSKSREVYETGNSNNRSRYLDYLISDYLIWKNYLDDEFEHKAFMNLKYMTKSYLASQRVKNIELFFDSVSELLDECQTELKNIKQSPSTSVDLKKSKMYPYLGHISGKWDAVGYRENMYTFYKSDDRVPLASCKYWAGEHQDSLSMVKKGKGKPSLKYRGIKPSCEKFELLKQCTGEFYQQAHEKYKKYPAKSTKPPRSKVLEYINTGKWPEKSFKNMITFAVPKNQASKNFVNLNVPLLAKDFKDAFTIYGSKYDSSLKMSIPASWPSQQIKKLAPKTLVNLGWPLRTLVTATNEKEIKVVNVMFLPFSTSASYSRPLIEAHLHALGSYYSEDIDEVADFIVNKDNVNKYHQTGLFFAGSSSFHFARASRFDEETIKAIEGSLKRKLKENEKVFLVLLSYPK